ncbi:hypothetical protein TNCV_2708311 [Trichonephila clavipes]|nr:hypothetical protein TNCV_2708311 [Trichonephila clavipes]
MQACDERSPRTLQRRIRPSNTARRIRIHLKRRRSATHVSSFVVEYIRIITSSDVALSREVEVITTLLTTHASANVVVLYEWILGGLQTCPFFD